MEESGKYGEKGSAGRHLDENELAAYADFLRGDAGSADPAATDHLASCAHCRSELMAITDLLDAVQEGEPYGQAAEPRPTYRTFTRPGTAPFHIVRTAAAVAAVVLLAWVVQRMLPDREPPLRMAEGTILRPADDSSGTAGNSDAVKPEDVTVAHTPPASDTVLFAGAFKPEPSLELMIGAVYRSGTDPNATGPGPETVLKPGDTLRIRWTPDPDDRYFLQVVNNRSETVSETAPLEGDRLDLPVNLAPGLYYWKFTGAGELWKVGKFRIIRR